MPMVPAELKFGVAVKLAQCLEALHFAPSLPHYLLFYFVYQHII